MIPQQYTITLAALLALASLQFSGAAAAMDAGAAEALAKSSMCLNCHDVTNKKIGPPYHEVAKKFKGVDGAEEKIVHHMTSGPMVKMPTGQMMKHMIIGTKDPAKLKNLAEWILSR